MNDDKTRAGANPAQPAPKPAQSEPLSQKTVNRAVALAMVHLEDTLMSSRFLFERCKAIVDAPLGDAQATLKTATQLLRNQSETAAALARVARGESRHRTIVEYADGAKPQERLNSKISGSPPPPESVPLTNGKRKPNGHAGE